MARTHSFSPAVKSLTFSATNTVVWNPAEIDSAGVIAFHLLVDSNNTTGTAVDASYINRIRIKANGQTVVDITGTQLRAYQERFSPKGGSDVSTESYLTIPLNALDSKSDDDGDRCQFMPGASATVEVTTSTLPAVVGSGTAALRLGWSKTTISPEFYMTLLSNQCNIGINQTNARVPLGGPGFVQGIGLNTAGLNRVRMILSGLEVANICGAQYNSSGTSGDLLRAISSLYDGVDDTSEITTYQYTKLAQGLEANPATSWLELTTGAGWGGTSNEISLYTLVPVQPQRA
jgi:hypothetical protein